MGNLCSSCFPTTASNSILDEDLTPDLETRRKKQMEAAESRIAEQQSRGIKNLESVKRQEMLDQQREKRQEGAGNLNVQNPLKWQVN